MKRSKTVALTLMSASAFALQACEERDVEGKVYQDLQACLDDGSYPENICREIYRDARIEHQTTAPRYVSENDCAAEYGPENCQRQETSGGGSFWMPLMMGYFAGQMLSGGRTSQPVYRTRNGDGLRTASGAKVADGFGRATMPGWATKPARSRTQSISRGGFGSRSSGFGRSSWGG